MAQINISLVDVTVDNWKNCIQLSPKEEQRNFVASNLYSIAQSKVEPNLKPCAIYAEDTMTGFVMFDTVPYPDDGCHWIMRFMIDAAYQGQGYGTAALQTVIDTLKQEYKATAIRISYVPDNTVARDLYVKLGFRDTGERDGEEIILQLGAQI
ncbi:GNAT family N-acetyltransferase [Paenibacillus sp. MER TA 81-3]|uniref:GNAT family N-acetyltransferase n=1 Tax=Paenibacillus sp. MER TA 81-3 TaxID=2939573 RepID=UPI002040AD8C|nr:GNAT family N-acetyltransferase [Paenibacillus sp. MER TA 81-3]MCM3340102.1 GNAT family N-acetyltransferase [Paenibacillus sp. MER TA 81-3]